MNLNIRFKGFEGSDKVKDYVIERAKKLDKFLPPTTVLNATLEDDKVRKIAEINLRYRGTDYISSQASDNLLTSIDDAVEKLVRQVSRAKQKQHDHGTESVKHLEEAGAEPDTEVEI
jgi:putative sigma-54 modulation protein